MPKEIEELTSGSGLRLRRLRLTALSLCGFAAAHGGKPPASRQLLPS